MNEYIDLATRVIEYPPVWVASLAFTITQVAKMAAKAYSVSVKPFLIRVMSLVIGSASGAILLDLPIAKATVAGLAIGGAVFVSYDLLTTGLSCLTAKASNWMARNK